MSEINSLIRQKASKNAYDAIIIGSGPNGLAAAILLAKAGLAVLLVEARDTIGGGCRTAELTLPGYLHDVCSSVYPLGYGSPFFRTLPLNDFGLRWINPNVSYAHPLDNDKAILVYRSIEETAKQFEEDADAYFKLMKSLQINWDTLSQILLNPLQWSSINKMMKHPFGMANFGLKSLMSAEFLSKITFRHSLAPAVFAGVSAHSALPLNSTASASIGLVLNIAAHAVGWPIPAGGAQELSNALAKYFIHLGGEIVTACNITSLNELPTSHLILCDLMPQTVSRLADNSLPLAYRKQLENYKYGPASFKMDWALDGPIPWNNPDCLKAPTVHLGGSFAEIAQSEYAINHDTYSNKPYVLLAQHSIFDASRAPANKHTAWAYCHVPNGSKMDMTEIIENQIERFAKGFKQRIIARNKISPSNFESYNANYIGGDINGGSLQFSQLLTRPVARLNPYSTPNEKIYLCSAATPPGSGVHGMAGYYAALLALSSWQRKKSMFLSALFICIICNICFPFIPTFASNKIKLALFVDKGAHARELLCTNLTNDKSLSVTYITGEDVCNNCLQNFDVLFVPGGSGKREALSLTPEGQKKVRLFVRDGGIYVGVCAGCYLASCAHPEYLGLFPMTTVDKEHWRRGKATLPIEFTNLGMEIFGVKESIVNVIYHNGPVLHAYPQYADKISILAYYRDEVVAPGGKTGAMVNAPAIVLARYGDGLVLGISPHPEATPGLTTIELNAIHWLYNHRPIQRSSISPTNEALTNVKQSIQISNNTNQLHKSLSPQIYNEAERIFENTISSHYQHIHDGAEQQAQEINGKYKVVTDCSGFVSYVINSVSPQHYDTIYQLSGRSYPHAKTYTKFINDLPVNTIVHGWYKINNFRELKRGDIIAWEKPVNPSTEGKASGHVMIVVNPAESPTYTDFNGKKIKYVEIYVLDSSSVEHFPPQSLPSLSKLQIRDGIGKGMIRLILNEQDDVIGFWEGTFSHEKDKVIKGPTYTNFVEFARLMSLL